MCGVFIGIIAGGDGTIRNSVEEAEDNQEQGWKDILAYKPTTEDSLVGITASGDAPYVAGAIKNAKEMGILRPVFPATMTRLWQRSPISPSLPW